MRDVPAASPAGAPHATVLEARDLDVTPAGAGEPVLRGVSLHVRAGEWIALTGANGGGKTSLLLALAGLCPVTAGTLELEGRPFGPGARGPSAGRVAVVLQDPSSQILSPTVGEELAFSARNLGLPEGEIAQSVARWSTALGLEGELGRDPASLSAGRQQLVLLAAALVARPRLLLADEPTAHVDAAGRERVLAALAAEVSAGLAIITATQEPVELAAATRRLVVGRAVTIPPPPMPPPRSRPAPPILRLRISPADPGEGPRVRVSGALEIEVSGTGVTALLGANGAGKSVLLAAVAGLERVAQVGVEWASPALLPPIAALQYPELQVFEEQVADELVFAAVARGLTRQAALAAATRQLGELGFDGPQFLRRRTWTLSTGEKRVVEVIAALIAPSSLVLLDEPTAGLDGGRRRALARLVTCRARRVPIIVASQDLGWVEAVATRVWTLGI